MTRVSLAASLALLTLLSGGAAHAASAAGCAAGLSPAAKAIYDAAAPGFAASADPRGLVRDKTMALVQAGTIGQNEARADAMAAGGCLKMLR